LPAELERKAPAAFITLIQRGPMLLCLFAIEILGRAGVLGPGNAYSLPIASRPGQELLHAGKI